MIVVFLASAFIVTACVIVHYEVLSKLPGFIQGIVHRPRTYVGISVLLALFAHIVEIWLFGFTYLFLLQYPSAGTLISNFDHSLLDCVYFSFTTYTSLGYGDITPAGPLRFLAGTEAIMGLVFIAWTASYMFVQMRKFWND